MTEPKHPRPIEKWSDQELLGHYRYTRTDLAGESGSRSEDDNRPIDVIVEEIRRRGLPVPTRPVESTPADRETSAGDRGAEPEEGAAPDPDQGLSDQEEPPLIG
jgi:hypothetical protein